MRIGSALRAWSILFAVVLVAIVVPTVSAQQTAASNYDQQTVRRSPAKAGTTTTQPTTQKAGARPAAASKGFSASRVAISLGAVLVLILLLRLGARRFLGMNATTRSTRAVQVLSRSPISPRQQLVVIRVGRRLLVCSDGGTQMSTLSEITDADEVAALLGQLQDDHEVRATKAFGSLFNKMRGTYEEQHDEPPSNEARSDESPADEQSLDETRKEMNGLMDRVRSLSRQFKSP